MGTCCKRIYEKLKTFTLILPCKCHYWHKNLYYGISLGLPLSAFLHATSILQSHFWYCNVAIQTYCYYFCNRMSKQHYRSTSIFTLHIITIISPEWTRTYVCQLCMSFLFKNVCPFFKPCLLPGMKIHSSYISFNWSVRMNMCHS